MNKEIVYISDFFSTDVLGGCELNDQELILMLKEKKYKVSKIRSREVTNSFVENNKNSFFIISNFISLSNEVKQKIESLNYIIYEHDHKYIKERNPSFFKNFEIPQHKIINYFFYKKARKIICQSTFHKEIVEKNLKLDNIISIGGNLWSDSILDKIEELSNNQKNNLYSIMDSNIRHKNTQGSVEFCLKKNKKYELIKDNKYEKFLEKMSKNEGFIFLPKSPETLSRVVVEARMLGCKVVTNQMVGAAKEKWFKLKGKDLINHMREKKIKIIETIEKIINDKPSEKQNPKVSIISTFYKAEDFLEGFLEDLISQTIFDDCELIVIDSGSPGKEQEIMNKYCKKYSNIQYIRYEDRFPPTIGHNIAMRLCNSKYITWAMIDDRKSPNFLEILYNELENNKHIDLVYGDCLATSVKNEKLCDTKSKKLSEHSINDFSRENMIKCLPGPMPMWSTRMINRVGFFNDKDHDFCDDWELWLRSVDNGCSFKKVNKIIGLYLEGGRSQIQNNLEQRKEEARVFFKYKHIFGTNYAKYFSYFNQFIEMGNG